MKKSELSNLCFFFLFVFLWESRAHNVVVSWNRCQRICYTGQHVCFLVEFILLSAFTQNISFCLLSNLFSHWQTKTDFFSHCLTIRLMKHTVPMKGSFLIKIIISSKLFWEQSISWLSYHISLSSFTLGKSSRLNQCLHRTDVFKSLLVNQYQHI